MAKKTQIIVTPGECMGLVDWHAGFVGPEGQIYSARGSTPSSAVAELERKLLIAKLEELARAPEEL